MLRKPLLSLLLLLGAPVLFGACSDSDDEKTGSAALIIDRESLDYGELEVGKTSPEQLFTIRNASPAAVESVSMSIDGQGFTITANTCERYLDAGMECEVRVKFTPKVAGAHEARLKVDGAPAVDQTVLKGMAVTSVEVASMPAGVRVVAGDDEWSCDQPCTMAVRTPELILRTAPGGYPIWDGACDTAPNNGCRLRMDGPKRVSVKSFSPLFQWEVRRASEPLNVASAPNGDILVLDSTTLTRLSSTGQELWTRSVPGASEMAVDGAGNVYLMDFAGRVTRRAADGQELWSHTPEGESLSAHSLVASASGHVYALVGLGSFETTRLFKLVSLTPEGTERWNVLFNDGERNYPTGLGVDPDGRVFVSGNTYIRGEAPGEFIFLKGYYQKFTTEGARVWATDSSWYEFVISPTGETSSFISVPGSVPAPGGFTHYWLGTDGKLQWSASSSSGPGIVLAQAFSSTGTLLIGGYEAIANSSNAARGWFSLMNLQTRTPGPVTYVEVAGGAGTRVSHVAFTSTGKVVVSGGGNPGTTGGFIRQYDARVLTGN
ncbi:choice-of-anchor D domain-containing protein [Pyxidicoccus caerfyrddinensis]|uniref:choice-of-anchor D domain-containing protein n=1 Tax=Pyxidicoccus caerfyrddinensis TaxID=2709663 RepID=UPI0013D983EF|nr:choice-of-anchor D domain-containing protein [Pyxidicoccus caerfyrddinensis]